MLLLMLCVVWAFLYTPTYNSVLPPVGGTLSKTTHVSPCTGVALYQQFGSRKTHIYRLWVSYIWKGAYIYFSVSDDPGFWCYSCRLQVYPSNGLLFHSHLSNVSWNKRLQSTFITQYYFEYDRGSAYLVPHFIRSISAQDFPSRTEPLDIASDCGSADCHASTEAEGKIADKGRVA